MRVRKIFAPVVSVTSATRNDRHFAGIARVRGEQPLTFVRRLCQLQFPEASWPAPSWSERRCGRYPPSYCLATEPGAAWSSEAMPGVISNVELHMTGRRFAAGRSPRTCHAPDCSLTDTRCRATEPVILSSTRIRAAHGCAALMGSPCAPARKPGTALDFRSRGGPLQVDDAAFREPIHSTALRARPSRRCRPCPARQDGITTPGRRRNAPPGWITLFHF